MLTDWNKNIQQNQHYESIINIHNLLCYVFLGFINFLLYFCNTNMTKRHKIGKTVIKYLYNSDLSTIILFLTIVPLFVNVTERKER